VGAAVLSDANIFTDELPINSHNRSTAVICLAHSENGLVPPAQLSKHSGLQLGQRAKTRPRRVFPAMNPPGAQRNRRVPTQVSRIGKRGWAVVGGVTRTPAWQPRQMLSAYAKAFGHTTSSLSRKGLITRAAGVDCEVPFVTPERSHAGT
jgi:hypothetical protein